MSLQPKTIIQQCKIKRSENDQTGPVTSSYVIRRLLVPHRLDLFLQLRPKLLSLCSERGDQFLGF